VLLVLVCDGIIRHSRIVIIRGELTA